MGLTQKILLFTSLLVVALVGGTVAYTTVEAERMARQSIDAGLGETRSVWETFQADRYRKLKLGVRVLANDSPFKATVESGDQATIHDMLGERGRDLGADFFVATDANGVVLARSDRPNQQAQDLSKDVLVAKPLAGEDATTVWRQDDKLFHAVSVPMQFSGRTVGVLIAAYAINETLASDIRKLTHSEVAFLSQGAGKAPEVSVSSLGPREGLLKAALGQLATGAGGAPFELMLGDDRQIGVLVPLKAASGEAVGSVLALRSLSGEMAAFRRFRDSLVVVGLVVMALGLGLAYAAASRITGPVRKLVELVDGARNGSYKGAVAVGTRDEIGKLAQAFNSLLADLREKETMIDFLREGMTEMRKGVVAPTDSTVDMASAPTMVTGGATAEGLTVPEGGLFDDRYEIRSTLGKGGMGVVYRALDRQLDEEVALKVLRPDVVKEAPTLLERFKQELKLARRITHRNVLRTHDFRVVGNTPYISMEYLEGVTLKELLISKGALPTPVGLRIAKQICYGLDAAHQQGVVHRDIKPQNMLILPETGDLKIMDFGISTVCDVKATSPSGADTGLTASGMVMGTPDYMPPEQAQGQPADFRSDIYALGVVLFEMFTARLPFKGKNPMQVVMAHIQEPCPRPRQFNPRIPPDVEAVILRCLEKEPAARYSKVSEILKDLTAISSRSDAA